MSPDYQPPDDATAQMALAGTSPFVMQADGRGWLFVPDGLLDGPLPTHYEPHESPLASPLYSQQSNPTRQVFDRPGNRSNPWTASPAARSSRTW
jgi:formate dehydrogenase major subunit